MFSKKFDLIDITIGIFGVLMFMLILVGFAIGTVCISLNTKIKTGKWWI